MQRVRVRHASPLVERPLTSTFWYAPLPDNATLDPSSAAISAEVLRQSTIAQPILNGSQNPPVWTSSTTIVPAGQPLIPGVCGHDATMTAIAAGGLPVPPDVYVPPAPDTDKAVIIYQPEAPQNGFMWEFQAFSWITPGVQWECNSLSRMSNANTRATGHFVDWTSGPGGSTPGATYSTWESQYWGIQGSGLPYAPGVLTLEDIQRGSVNHALLLEVVDAASGVHPWPAARSDGGAAAGSSAATLAEGMWLRLPASFTIDPAWSLITRLYAQAARDYGLLITDRTEFCLSVRCEPAAQPYVDDAHLTSFPWSSLQCTLAGSDTTWHPTS